MHEQWIQINHFMQRKLCNTAAIVVIILDLYNVITEIMHTPNIFSFSHCFRAMLAVDKSVYSHG